MVTVTVDINPITFWRKHLFVRIRRPALRREMHDSLAALGAAAAGQQAAAAAEKNKRRTPSSQAASFGRTLPLSG